MKLNQILLITSIGILLMLINKPKPKQVVKEEVVYQDQHPRYPFVQYDIREALPPSRRTYMRYPYYFHRYGIYQR